MYMTNQYKSNCLEWKWWKRKCFSNNCYYFYLKGTTYVWLFAYIFGQKFECYLKLIWSTKRFILRCLGISFSFIQKQCYKVSLLLKKRILVVHKFLFSFWLKGYKCQMTIQLYSTIISFLFFGDCFPRQSCHFWVIHLKEEIHFPLLLLV